MSIDERWDRLTQRHEALAQSIALMIAEGREQAERIRALAHIAEIRERSLTHPEGDES
jgi:hypothetical protein